MLLSGKFPVLLFENGTGRKRKTPTCAGLVILGELTADN